MNFKKDVYFTSYLMSTSAAHTFLLLFSFLLFLINTANADSTIATITVDKGPYGAIFNPDNGYIYTANVASNSITVIDGSTNKAIATITESAGQTPRELAFNSANSYIYVADVYSNTVSVIDPKTNKLLTSIPTGGSIVDGVAYDSSNGNIYAVNAGSGTVSVIDSSNKVIDTITVGSNPLEDEFNPDNGYIYVANEGSGSVSVIDGSTSKVIDTISGIADPVQLVYNPSNHYMYVAGHNSNSISIIDTQTNKLIDTLTGFKDPTGVGYNSATGNVYLGNQGSNYVSILSGSTNKVIENVTVGQGPVTPVFDPNNGNVYVTNFNSNESPGNTVSVIASSSPPPPPPEQPPTQTTITSAKDGDGNPIQNGSTTFSTSISLQVTATKGSNPISGFECSLDDKPFSMCANTNPATINFNNLAAGQQHTIAVRAIDNVANTDPNPATLKWTIISPQQAIQKLVSTIDNMHLSRGAMKSLEVPLIVTIRLLNSHLSTAACNTFNAFLNNVNANQASGQLTAQQAATLREEAAPIQRAMGCALSPLSLSIDSTNNSTAVETINTKSQATTTPSTTPRPQQQPPTAYGLNNHNNKSDNRSPTIVSVLPF